jgi:hypothetical protein
MASSRLRGRSSRARQRHAMAPVGRARLLQLLRGARQPYESGGVLASLHGFPTGSPG